MRWRSWAGPSGESEAKACARDARLPCKGTKLCGKTGAAQGKTFFQREDFLSLTGNMDNFPKLCREKETILQRSAQNKKPAKGAMDKPSKNAPHCRGKIWGFLQIVTKGYKKKSPEMA